VIQDKNTLALKRSEKRRTGGRDKKKR